MGDGFDSVIGRIRLRPKRNLGDHRRFLRKLNSQAQSAAGTIDMTAEGLPGLPSGAAGSRAAVTRENAGQRHIGVQRSGGFRGCLARVGVPRPTRHRSRHVSRTADPDHTAPPAALGRRGAPAADPARRRAARHDPGCAAWNRGTRTGLGRDQHGIARYHDAWAGRAPAHAKLRPISLGRDLVAGLGTAPVCQRDDRNHFCYPFFSSSMAANGQRSAGICATFIPPP
jgi:hypothetical protein